MAVREVNWLELPDHLTVLVTDKLSRCDFIRFGAVCKPWLSILVADPRRSVPHQLPLLLFPGDKVLDGIQDIYEPIEKRISTFQVAVPHLSQCYGSSHGWLFTTWWEDRTLKVFLTNPLLTAPKTIELPPLKKNDICVTKAVLSANPTSNPNYVVMVILRNPERLAFFKPSGDKADWIYILHVESENIVDILFSRDRFYFVDKSGTLFACDLGHPCKPTVLPVLTPLPTFALDEEEDKAKHLYLVELSSGDLLLIKRLTKIFEDYDPSYTFGFSAYKMNPLVDLKWIEVQNLCGDTVFLGDCYSSSLRASDFPGCKQNCIYFADYGYFSSEGDPIGPDYVGIFNLEDGSIERQLPIEKPQFRVSWVPVWIEPTSLRQC